MILKVSVFVIGLFVNAALSASIDCNIEQCAKSTKVYEEIGCKAVYGSKSCCAKRFECPDFKKMDDNKCIFEGRQFAIGEILPRNFTDNKCSETCFCSRQENEPAKFECSNSDCGVSSFNVPGCINLYGDLNECCSTSIVCDDAEKETLAACFVEKEYREGEKFIPASNPCYECLCHKDFDNSTITGNPHCRKLNCKIDLRYKSFVQRGCLPVFHSEKCCPVDWECPKHSKKIVKRAANDESQTEKQDVFIVTPSKNLDSYLDIVRLANKAEASSEVESEATTDSTFVATISTNPFLAPNNEEATVAVVVKVDEVTTTSTEAAVTESAVSETTQSLTSVETTKASTTVAESSSIASEVQPTVKVLETTQASTETSQTSTESSTTQASTTNAQSSSSSSSSESEESDESKPKPSEEEENLFGEDIDEEKVTDAPQSTESAKTEAPTSEETTSEVVKTTEAQRESARSLQQPEELTTLAQEPTTTSEVPLTSSEASSSSSEVPLNSSEAPITTTEDPVTPTEAATTKALESEVKVVIQEVFTQPPSEVATVLPVTEEPKSTESPPAELAVSPTEFNKLLTTLREFVALVDATTSTKAPEPSKEVPQVDKIVEFVNYTVSSDKEKVNDEPKSISKRSVPDADLIPRYFKQHYSLNKEKSCNFNGRSFKVGEVIKTDNDCLKCSCAYAPIGHCMLKEKCNF